MRIHTWYYYKKIVFPAVWFSLFYVLFGCASYTQSTEEMRQQFQHGSYEEAIEALNKSDIKPDNRHRLLFFLEKAMILDRMDDLKASRKYLLQADKVADELYTTSISKSVATLLYNESASDYSGEDYEIVAIHTMLALSFIEDDDLAAATVQARKINNKLHEINQRHGDSSNKYKTDAFSLMLSGIIFEARGNIDDAIIDYKKALDLYAGTYKDFYQGRVPELLVTSLARLYAKRGRNDSLKELEKSYPKIVDPAENQDSAREELGSLVVVHELGHIAYKVAEEHILPISGQVVRFSFPVIRESRYYSSGKTGVSLDSESAAKGKKDRNGFFSAENFQDMNAIAKQTLEDRMGRMLLKQGARLLIKGQMNYQAEKKFGTLGGLVANAVTAATETADTRGWTLLPGAFNISRVDLPPGTYKISIKNEGRTALVKEVVIKGGKIEILRAK